MEDRLRDPQRLAALARTQLMDTPPEEVFDRITRLAAKLLGAETALMSLVDDQRQYFKSKVGFDLKQTPLSQAVCQFVVADAAPLVITDVREDPRVCEELDVADLAVVSYCGVPLTDGEGHTLGSFCAAGSAPRAWTQAEVEVLTELAAGVMTELELRDAIRGLKAQQEEMSALIRSAHDAFIAVDTEGRIRGWNPAAHALFGWTPEEAIGRPAIETLLPADDPGRAAEESGQEDPNARSFMRRALRGETLVARALPRRHRDGHLIYVDVSGAPTRNQSGEIIGATAVARDVTQQHRLAQRLARSEAHFRMTFDEAPIGIALIGLDGGWLQVNRALCEIAGCAEDELRAVSLAQITHPEDRDSDADLVRRLIAGEIKTYQIEKRFIGRAGGFIWGRLSVALARDEQGAPSHFVVHVEDVTQAHAVRAARREVEARQRILLSNLPDTMVALYDSDLRCTLLQGALLEPLGLDPAAFEGRLLSELVNAEQFGQLRPHFTRALAGEPTSIEYLAGADRTYHVDIAPYRTDDGEITGTFTVWRDITDRLERERQMRMLATIVEQSDDAIIAKSREGIITEWNHGAEMLYGYSPDEAIGRPISIIIPDERRGEEHKLLGLALDGEALTLETTRRRKDGGLIDVSISMSPLHGAGDDVVGASVIARDVTDRKRMEDELRASREQALEASRLKSEFVANMSHEIRTPLNGVVSMAELLLDTRLGVEQREYAQVAMTSAEALMRVINDILDFSKIEAGKLEILAEDFSVRAAVGEVAEIVGVKAAERGLELGVVVDGGVAQVLRGDGNRVRQVLMNLLSNAVKFTAQGSVTVHVGLTAGDGDGAGRLRVEVADTGIGIDPDRLGELFQPFSQADATTTRRYGGTGLGLCISKQLVELMGGEIDCESVPGQGSRFWFTLPYTRGSGFESLPVDSDLTGTRMLIVDSDLEDRRMLESGLASWGISPDSAADGATALSLLRRAVQAGRPYETALIAQALPGMDGLELATTIKSVPALRATRLVMLTGTPIDGTLARAAGIDGQVAKPVRQSRLYNQLLATLYRARGGRRPAVAARGDAASRGGARAGLVGGAGAGAIAGGASEGPAPEGEIRVLVAEDNEVNQFAAIRLLQTLGLGVDVAKDGREAIRMSARRSYAAIFMDCQMPQIDGYTATREIRRRERGGTRTPIIALTAHALEGDREKCLAAGMDEYLAKPLRLAAIEALMQRVPALTGDVAEPVEALAVDSGAPEDLGPVFDPAALREIGDPETEAALAAMFLDQATERVPALLEAIETPDAERLHALAHGLKGSAATVGAARMSELARELCEIAGGQLAPGVAAQVHNRLADALGETRSAMDAYVADIAPRA